MNTENVLWISGSLLTAGLLMFALARPFRLEELSLFGQKVKLDKPFIWLGKRWLLFPSIVILTLGGVFLGLGAWLKLFSSPPKTEGARVVVLNNGQIVAVQEVEIHGSRMLQEVPLPSHSSPTEPNKPRIIQEETVDREATALLTWGMQRQLEQYFAAGIHNHPDWPVILSAGDSWSSFPLHADPIDDLDDLAHHRINLLRLARPGTTAVDLSGRQGANIRKYLNAYPVNVLIVSAGMMDLVPNLRNFLVPGGSNCTAIQHCLDLQGLATQLGTIRLAFENLIRTRDLNRPNCIIVVIGYDYFQPTGIGAQLGGLKFGPWIAPSLREAGIYAPGDQKLISKYIVDRLYSEWDWLKQGHKGFEVVDLRTALEDTKWNDELHPSRRGFMRVAEHLRSTLKSYGYM